MEEEAGDGEVAEGATSCLETHRTGTRRTIPVVRQRREEEHNNQPNRKEGTRGTSDKSAVQALNTKCSDSNKKAINRNI